MFEGAVPFFQSITQKSILDSGLEEILEFLSKMQWQLALI